MKTIILDGGWLWLEIYYIRLKMLRKEVLGKTARETKQILCPSFTKALGDLLDSADGNHTFECVQVKAQAKGRSQVFPRAGGAGDRAARWFYSTGVARKAAGRG